MGVLPGNAARALLPRFAPRPRCPSTMADVDSYRLTNYEIPAVLHGVPCVTKGEVLLPRAAAAKQTKAAYPSIYAQPELTFGLNREVVEVGRRMRVAVVLGGGTAPGHVELIIGLYNYLKKWNSTSTLLAMRLGMQALTTGDHVVVEDDCCRQLVFEQGLGQIGTSGYHLVDKDYPAVADICKKLSLTGIVILGGSAYMKQAAGLAQYLNAHEVGTQVLAASKRLEVSNQSRSNLPLEIGVGFDSVTKMFSFLVGNLCADVASAQSSYHIVRLMGDERSGSLTLEVALDTHPNIVFVNEEVRAKNQTLTDLIHHACDVICARARSGRNYGVVLLPEGILSAIPELSQLLLDVGEVIAREVDPPQTLDAVLKLLPASSVDVAKRLPPWFVEQIFSRRKRLLNEAHSAEIQVERLFGTLLAAELKARKAAGTYVGKFAFQSHFFGYETRCQQPSLMDCQLGATLGTTAGVLLERGTTGYLVGVRGLSQKVADWAPAATPLTSLFTLGPRGELDVASGSVKLDGYPFQALAMLRDEWIEDRYRPSMGTLSDRLSATALLSDLQTRHDTTQLMRPVDKTRELIDAVKSHSVQRNAFLQQRLDFAPPVPGVLRGGCSIQKIAIKPELSDAAQATLKGLFPNTFTCTEAYRVGLNTSQQPMRTGRPLRIGIVLSGGPAPGGHNIISGLYDFLQARNTESVLFGFLKGPSGLLDNKTVTITAEILKNYRNQGGFNLIGTSRTKIESKAQFETAARTVGALRLDGLVICGGDDSNTNAALLADYFVGTGVRCGVVGMPKTIDADLRSDTLEMSFGFDTSTKVYASILANVMQECLVRADRWHFVRVMGRAASHIAVEVALQTHPNYTIVSEEVDKLQRPLVAIVHDIADLVSARYKAGKNYGTVVVPEGLIEFTTDMKKLVAELNELLVGESSTELSERLTPASRAVYQQLPDWLRSQLLSDRDPHGNVRVSLIESERLLATLVGEELCRRRDPAGDSYKFWCHFLGYQGRCALTSNFDCIYTYVLGHLGGTLVEGGATGVLAAVRNLCSSVESWELLGLPITGMMRLERRHGKDKPVIEKKLVDLDGRVFQLFKRRRREWAMGDHYPSRSKMRTGHLSGVHDMLPTQTLLIEFPPKAGGKCAKL